MTVATWGRRGGEHTLHPTHLDNLHVVIGEIIQDVVVHLKRDERRGSR
jgi:hypothetical protein